MLVYGILLLFILMVCNCIPFSTNTTLMEKVYTDGYPNLLLSYQEDLIRYSEYAALAYCSRSSAGLKTGVLEEACNCKLCHGQTKFVEAIYRGIVSAVIFRDEEMKEIILSIKGTTNKKEWVIDGKAYKKKYKWIESGESVCHGCMVHAGFYNAAKVTWKEIVKPLLIPLHNQYKGYSIAIVGHSLGGSIGIFIGNELKSMGRDCRILTFGSPKIGDSHLAQWMDNEWNVEGVSISLSQDETGRIPNNSYLRVTNAKDVVPYLPSVDLGFHHSGSEILFKLPQTPPAFEEVLVRGKFHKKESRKEERAFPNLLWGSSKNKYRHNTYITSMNKCVAG